MRTSKVPIIDATRRAVIHVKPSDVERSDDPKSAVARACGRELHANSTEVSNGFTVVELPAKVAAQYGKPPRTHGPVLVRFKTPPSLAPANEAERKRRKARGIGTRMHPYAGAHARRLQYRFETMERTHYNTGKRKLSVAGLTKQVEATQPGLRDASPMALSAYLVTLKEAVACVESLLVKSTGKIVLLPVKAA